MSAPALHADATRSTHLRALLGRPRTIVLVAGAVLVAGGVTAALAGIGWGAAAVAAVALVALLVLFVIADAKAEEDFFNGYASARSLATGGGRGDLPPATDLLRKGVRNYTDRAFAGKLAGRVDGVLAYYTYETETTDSKGNRHIQYHNFTVALVAVPEASGFLGELALQRRAGFRFFDKAEDVFRKRQRVEHESEEVDKRYEIFIGPGDDMNRARQLLSPQFIDWLARGDENMGFELENGMLAVNVPGHHDTAAELDAICEAAAETAERIAAEARESAPAGASGPASGFDPASCISTQESGKSSERLKRRVWALVGLLAIPIGLGVGLLTSGEGDSGGSDYSYEYGSDFEFGSQRLADEDATLLPLIARLDRGRGVRTDDLWGHGVPRGVIDGWLGDALVRGVIELDPQTLTFRLTPRGEREAKRG